MMKMKIIRGGSRRKAEVLEAGAALATSTENRKAAAALNERIARTVRQFSEAEAAEVEIAVSTLAQLARTLGKTTVGTSTNYRQLSSYQRSPASPLSKPVAVPKMCHKDAW